MVKCNRIILPPLHIKLGLMKQFVKALDKDGACFSCIGKAFPGLSHEKLKAGIFDGTQIRKLMKDEDFVLHMNADESAAWCSYIYISSERVPG